jgi:integrase
MKRHDTSSLYFVKKIPADVRARAVGTKLHIQVGGSVSVLAITAATQSVRVSLKTADPKTAKMRSTHIESYLENVWHSLRSDEEVSLTHRQAVALAGELYRGWVERRAKVSAVVIDMETREARKIAPTPEDNELWPVGYLHHAPDGERDVGPLVDILLKARGVARLDEGSREMITHEFIKALGDAADTNAKQSAGDYSPDLKLTKFPEWTPPGKGAVEFKDLLDGWWAEAKATGRSQATYNMYCSGFKTLEAFLGHSDAAKIKPSHMVDYKNHRLAAGISAKTIVGGDFAAFNSIFKWAVANLKLPGNPAAGIKVQSQKTVKLREKGFEPDEAAAILTYAMDHKAGSRQQDKTPKSSAIRRWVPWLCAYTGARVGEMVQLRKKDITEEGGVYSITITPEAGTVKTKELRTVPVHEHLVATGFIDFVEASEDGYLFLPPSNDFWKVYSSAKALVSRFVREVVTDPNVAPNHGWRHAFKTVGRQAGIADSTLDAICGHAAATQGGRYGSVTASTRQEAMGRFPRYIP